MMAYSGIGGKAASRVLKFYRMDGAADMLPWEDPTLPGRDRSRSRRDDG
jgi:hypothetical protein